jgi:hypothetical protein
MEVIGVAFRVVGGCCESKRKQQAFVVPEVVDVDGDAH